MEPRNASSSPINNGCQYPNARDARSLSDLGSQDCTGIDPPPGASPFVHLVRSVDWGRTSLGPMNGWSWQLRQCFNYLLRDPRPASMIWGPRNAVLYNEAYVPVMGHKHPSMMGAPFDVVWEEIWPQFSKLFDQIRSDGKAIKMDEGRYQLQRIGYTEETFYDVTLIPLYEGDFIMGFMNPVVERTKCCIATRRLSTLLTLGEDIAKAKDLKTLWKDVLGGLRSNKSDIPFALLYSVNDNDHSDSDTISTSSESSTAMRCCMLEEVLGGLPEGHAEIFPAMRFCTLEGTVGRVPEGHAATPQVVNLQNCDEVWARPFREAARKRDATILSADSGSLPRILIDGITGDPPKTVAVLPVRPTQGESVLAFLVLGISNQRPYDEDYQVFVRLLSRQLGSALTSVLLIANEIQRAKSAADQALLDAAKLEEQLALQAQEAAKSEARFQRLADTGKVALWVTNSEGIVTFANKAYYDITGLSVDSNATAWLDSILEEDLPTFNNVWEQLINDRTPVTFEIRLKRRWKSNDSYSNGKEELMEGPMWILTSAYTDVAADGSIEGVSGCLTDISQQKLAEGIQKRRTEEALETKRQQEGFIDMTAHELRNPLSAIIQCADGIVSNLTEVQNDSTTPSRDLLTDTIDAAQTITVCSMHQKRIIDDVLTLSKLDADLLLITPTDVQPLQFLQHALKMFEGELQANKIKMKLNAEKSCRDLGVVWVRLDSSRLLQILINLLTNAIKFTATEAKRNITITLRATRTRPPSYDVHYLPTKGNLDDFELGPEWGDGEKIFLYFAVQDSGVGLSPTEKDHLFKRFSQASPRTHIKYGGSGLGLFISRKLTELQGGEIGVASEKGSGSTFAFYVQTRKSKTSVQNVELDLAKAQVNGGTKDPSPKNQSSSDIPFNTVSELPTHLKSHTINGAATVDRLSVLLVEDNLVNQKVMKKQLSNKGYVVHVANHGQEALDYLEQTTFWKGKENDGRELSIILMDIEMPIMGGLECVREVRKRQVEGLIQGHIPIIATTANVRNEQITTAKEAGMDDVIPKPFRLTELIPKIERLIA